MAEPPVRVRTDAPALRDNTAEWLPKSEEGDFSTQSGTAFPQFESSAYHRTPISKASKEKSTVNLDYGLNFNRFATEASLQFSPEKISESQRREARTLAMTQCSEMKEKTQKSHIFDEGAQIPTDWSSTSGTTHNAEKVEDDVQTRMSYKKSDPECNHYDILTGADHEAPEERESQAHRSGEFFEGLQPLRSTAVSESTFNPITHAPRRDEVL